MRYVFINNAGIPVYTSWLANPDDEVVAPEGLIKVTQPSEISEINLLENYVYSAGNWLQRPHNLKRSFAYNADTNQWFDSRSVPEMKLQSWEEIKTARDTALTAPLVTDYGTFDADRLSQKNITDAIQLLQTLEVQQPNQTIEFTLYDNTTTTLTTEQMVNVGLALGQRTQQIYATSRQLRQQLDQAQTQQEVEAISWPI